MPKQTQITAMFDDIAPHYDFLNHLLSFRTDKTWRNKAARQVARFGPQSILDMATGTGDMALCLAKHCPHAQITGIDLSEKMLDIANEKTREQHLESNIRFEKGDACALRFDDNSLDAVSVSFGVRNFSDLEAGLNEIHRVLKDGGRAVIMEFSMPKNIIFNRLYRFYFKNILPMIGKAVSKSKTAYSYLPASVAQFPSPVHFVQMIESCGLECQQTTSLSFGIATIFTCRKKQEKNS